jgi:hypothetical protein
LKIEFTLTYEEYKESRQSNFRNVPGSPTIGIIGAMVAASAACLFFGGEILLQSSFDLHGVGFKIVLVGILSALSIPIAWRWRKGKDRELSEVPVQADFEHFAKERKRIFEANESCWTFRLEYGDDSRPWSSLASFWERDQIFVLSTKGDVYVLPKRSFSEEQYADVKKWARNSMKGQTANALVRVTAHPTGWGYAISAASQLWQYKPTGLLLLFGVLCSSIWMLWDQVSHIGQPGSDHEGRIIAILMIMISLWYLLSPLSQYGEYKKLVEAAPGMEMIFTPEAVLVEGPKSMSLLAYDRFRKVVESRNAFLLYYDDKQFSMLPKQGISENQVEEISRLLATRFKENS